MPGARVRIDKVSRRYQLGAETVWALREVSLEIAPGEFVAVIGRSGSGKTTLLNLIAGLDRPSGGSVFIDDREISACSEDDLTQIRRHRIGFIFQSFGLLPLLSAYENVELALRIAGASRAERGRRAREVLDLVGLGKRINHRPYELSGGEQQRVAIARALANRPALILADEPTGELDSTTAITIFALLREVVQREGVTLITSTHDRTVMELAGRVEEIVDGRIAASSQRSLLQYVTQRDGGRARPSAQVAVLDLPAAPQAVDRSPGASQSETREAPQRSWAAPAEPSPSSEENNQGDHGQEDRDNEETPEEPDDITRWAPPERRS